MSGCGTDAPIVPIVPIVPVALVAPVTRVEPVSESRPAFRSTVEARTSGDTTTVTVSIRTPAGDLPVQHAELRDLSVQRGDSEVERGSVSFEPGLHGCTFTFDLPGTASFDLTAVAVLKNPDGSTWATLPIEERWPRP